MIEVVRIPGGSFLMGSSDNYDESPQHQVTVSSFLMGKFTVTQAQWKAVAGLSIVNRVLDPNPSYFQGDNRPVEKVSWYEAVEFCARLSQRTGEQYRLPSEAEWEYACRAGTTTLFHFGETITTDLANHDTEEYQLGTTSVGIFPPNAFGLYDMHGNVFEWCQDVWHDSYQGAPDDGSAWVESGDQSQRVLRGGSWFLNPRFCCSAFRFSAEPVYRNYATGFRVVCDIA